MLRRYYKKLQFICTNSPVKPICLTTFVKLSEHSCTPLTEAKFVIQVENEHPAAWVGLRYTLHTTNSTVKHRLTPATPSSMLSSPLDVVEQCVSSTNDGHFLHHRSIGHVPSDRDSTKSTLQSFLQFLDRHYHHHGVNSAYKEIIRVCITEMLASCQSEAAMMDENTRDSSTDLQVILGESLRPSYQYNELNAVRPPAFQHLEGQLSNQAYDPLSQESVNTLPEWADLPFRQSSPGWFVICI
jgi:hypothetical protein